MTVSNGRSSVNTQILEEASAWLIEFGEGEVDDGARRDFSRWLRTSPEHVRAYLQVSAFWDDAPLLNRSRRLSTEELIARARAHNKILPIASSQRSGQPRRGRNRFWSKARPSVAIAASVAMLILAGTATWIEFVRDVYSTGIGEQRSITLTDGSTIELNAHSRVRIRFSDAERTAILLDGQALFHVAKDSSRPFVVRSEAVRVRAVGTQFDVNQIHAGTVVTVLEGKVAVLPPAGVVGSGISNPGALPGHSPNDRSVPPSHNREPADEIRAPQSALQPVYVSAGEQVTVLGNTAPELTRADAAAVTAWRQRKLQFAAAPLTEVADEYNRYHEKRLVVREPSLDDFHVSGVFSATDSASLLEFLRQQPTLVIRESATEIEITGK